MKGQIIVIGKDESEIQRWSSLLKKMDIEVVMETENVPIDVTVLSQQIQDRSCAVAMVDLDGLSLEKRFFRDLKKSHPDLIIMGASERPFHPELAEDISNYMYACLKKPVDAEELTFLLKGIFDNQKTKDSSEREPNVQKRN